MRFRDARTVALLLLGALGPGYCRAAQTLTWNEIRERFRASHPALQASRLMTDESRANEVTAGLRPNPVLSSINDQFSTTHFRPFQTAQWTESVTQLIERGHKRPLRVESAKLATSIAAADQEDTERQLLFTLRDAYIRTLQSAALVAVAQENLKSYDKVLEVNRQRFQAGDIAKVDLTRLELQRAQFESDLVNARVNLRSAKIALLSMMNDRRPPESVEIAGDFAFRALSLTQDEARQQALDSRPDLRSAENTVAKAQADHKLAIADGATDPTLYAEYQRTQADNTLGFGVILPLRIFDRNQGEKERSAIEIRRAGESRNAVELGVRRDVDSAYEQVNGVRDLLLPYRDRYLPQARDVRETVSFAYSHGGASLLEFLDAQKSYRDTELAYQNLIAAYLSSVNQLNLAVGREVMQ